MNYPKIVSIALRLDRNKVLC